MFKGNKMDTQFDPSLQPELDENFTTERFKGKVAVVTGGASGIGLTVGYRLAHDGAKVVILDINEGAGKKSEEYFKDKGLKVCFRKCDVANISQCKDVISSFVADESTRGEIDFLVNCAVKFVFKGLGATESDWSSNMAVNITGSSNMVQACFPYFNKKNSSSIVNISSAAGHCAVASRWEYCASKGAIIQLTKCMALDLSEYNIRVNSVSPGPTWTPQVSKEFNGDQEAAETKIKELKLMPHLCRSSEVASVIAFLCSRDAGYITGANIPVDGGYSAMGPEGKGGSAKFKNHIINQH